MTVLAFAETTANALATATTSGTANVIVAAPALTFDGNTFAVISFGHTAWGQSATGNFSRVGLFDNAVLLGTFWSGQPWVAIEGQGGGVFTRRVKPSAGSHTFDVRGWVSAGTLTIAGGPDPSGPSNDYPNFILITTDPV